MRNQIFGLAVDIRDTFFLNDYAYSVAASTTGSCAAEKMSVVIELYNATTNTLSLFSNLTEARISLSAASTNGYFFFAGGINASQAPYVS